MYPHLPVHKRTNSSHSRPGRRPRPHHRCGAGDQLQGARGGAGVPLRRPGSASLSHLDLGLISSMSLRCRLTRCQGQKRTGHKPQPHWEHFPCHRPGPLLPPSGEASGRSLAHPACGARLDGARAQRRLWGRGAGRGPGLSTACGVRAVDGAQVSALPVGGGLDGAWGWTGARSQHCLWGEG